MIKEVHVNTGPNPSDTYWATQPGYSSVPNFRPLHDCGRRRDRRHLPLNVAAQRDHGPEEHRARERPHGVAELWGTNTNNKKWKPWRDAMKSDGLSASTYAQSSPDEDFAESWALFMEVRHGPREEELRLLFPARWAILATLW